jgi:predicted enzyme related to lactoylglutathione lyase
MFETSRAPLHSVTWWEIPASNLAASKAFYSAVLGWTYTSFSDPDAYAGILNDGHLIGGLYRVDPDTPTTSPIRIYVNVSDLEAALAAAEQAGGTVVAARQEVGGDMGSWGEIADPDGRWLGLSTDRPARGR